MVHFVLVKQDKTSNSSDNAFEMVDGFSFIYLNDEKLTSTMQLSKFLAKLFSFYNELFEFSFKEMTNKLKKDNITLIHEFVGI